MQTTLGCGHQVALTGQTALDAYSVSEHARACAEAFDTAAQAEPVPAPWPSDLAAVTLLELLREAGEDTAYAPVRYLDRNGWLVSLAPMWVGGQLVLVGVEDLAQAPVNVTLAAADVLGAE